MTDQAVSEQARKKVLEFVTGSGLAALGSERRQGGATEAELTTRLKSVLSGLKLKPESEALIRSMILLWHDHPDASHRLSQEVDTADGSYVHGLMHRREPDYGNAKYWFRRVGSHPCFPRLAERVVREDLAGKPKPWVERLVSGGRWDAFVMVDLCEEVAGRGESDGDVQALRRIQGMEFEVLLEYLLG